MADRLLYIEAYNIIPKHQFGFRKNHSTIQQIHRVVNKMYTDFDNKRFCVSIFIDVAKAFDKVWHLGLLHKLKCNLAKNFYLILESYLDQRKFFIKYKDETSNLNDISA